MYELIKSLCSKNGISITYLCEHVTGSKGNLQTWKKDNIKPTSLKKIAEAKQYREENHYHYSIAVDGCCNENYYKQLYEAGVDVFIVGTSGLFGKNTDTKKALDIAVSNIELATR